MSTKLPWDYSPELLPERLRIIAALIKNARDSALDRYDPQGGESPWSLGCCAFDRCRFQIKMAADSGDFSWLSVICPNLDFQFLIGRVPVRFYRGDPEKPNERTLRQSYRELRQWSLDLRDIGPAQILWRFAVETFDDGDIEQITFVGLTPNGDVVCSWTVPLTESVPVFSLVSDTELEEGVKLNPPIVGTKEKQDTTTDSKPQQSSGTND